METKDAVTVNFKNLSNKWFLLLTISSLVFFVAIALAVNTVTDSIIFSSSVSSAISKFEFYSTATIYASLCLAASILPIFIKCLQKFLVYNKLYIMQELREKNDKDK